MGRSRYRRLRRGVRRLRNLLTCCVRGETTDRRGSSRSPLRVRTSWVVRHYAIDSPPRPTLSPLHGMGEDDVVEFSVGDLETAVSSVGIDYDYYNYSIPRRDNPEYYRGHYFSHSESFSTVTTNYSLPQWDDTESVAGSITSCCDSLVTVTDRDTSDGYSADGDVSDSDSEFSLDGQSGIQIEGIIKIPDQCQVSTRTDPDIDHQEVEHYIHDLLERVMDNVRTEFIANEQKTAATSDDNTPPDVGVSSKSSMPATVDDEDIDHQEVGNDIHGLLERVSVAMADDTLATVEVQKSQSEDRSNAILQPAGGSAETKDHQLLQSILNDGHYNISPEDHTALESVIATLDTTSVLAISSEEDTDRVSADDLSVLKVQTYEDKSDDIVQPVRESVKSYDYQILQSILNDGYYDISSEDRTALESVIANLDTSSVLEISEENTDLSTADVSDVEVTTTNSNSDMSCDEQQLLTSVPFVRLSDMSQEDRETFHVITAALHANEGDDQVEGSVSETENSSKETDSADEQSKRVSAAVADENLAAVKVKKVGYKSKKNSQSAEDVKTNDCQILPSDGPGHCNISLEDCAPLETVLIPVLTTAVPKTECTLNKQLDDHEVEMYANGPIERAIRTVNADITTCAVAAMSEDSPPLLTTADEDIDFLEVETYAHDLMERTIKRVNADISLKEKVETTVDNKSPLFGTGSSSSRVAKESSNIATMNPPNIETDEDIGDREVETYMYAPDHMMKRAIEKVSADVTQEKDATVEERFSLETGSSHVDCERERRRRDLTADTISQSVESDTDQESLEYAILEATSADAAVEVMENEENSQSSSCVLYECSEEESEQTILSADSTLSSKDTQCNNELRQRSELCVFEVKLVQGLLGLGLTLGSDELKEIVIQKIRMFSPAAIQGELRVGDRIMEINGRTVIGKSPSQAQRLLSQVKWGGEVRILTMPPQETVVFHFSETSNAGVIVMKLNTSSDKPLGVDVEGGSDTECPYICISAIKPGSVAERCGMLKVGDELVEIDQHLMVGTTHSEAVDILRHISKPITLTVQRRQSLNLMGRIHSHHSEQKLTGFKTLHL